MLEKKYLVTVDVGTEAGEEIFRVVATDKDSGELGRINYQISPDTPLATRAYFRVDAETGAISLKRSLDTVDDDQLPLRLTVAARDNPDNVGDSKMEKTEIIVNVLSEDNLIVLTVKDTAPDKVESMTDSLTEIIQDQTNLIVEVSDIVPSLVEAANGSCCVESESGSDVWFYAINPSDQKILDVNNSLVQR